MRVLIVGMDSVISQASQHGICIRITVVESSIRRRAELMSDAFQFVVDEGAHLAKHTGTYGQQ